MISPVNVVTEEKVVVRFDVAVVVGNSPQVEEAHQVLVLTVHVPEHFDGRFAPQHHRLLFEDLLTCVCQRYNVLTAEGKVPTAVVLSSPFPRPQQMGEEKIVEGILLAGWLERNLRFLRLRVLVLLEGLECYNLCGTRPCFGLHFGTRNADPHVLSRQLLHRRRHASLLLRGAG